MINKPDSSHLSETEQIQVNDHYFRALGLFVLAASVFMLAIVLLVITANLLMTLPVALFSIVAAILAIQRIQPILVSSNCVVLTTLFVTFASYTGLFSISSTTAWLIFTAVFAVLYTPVWLALFVMTSLGACLAMMPTVTQAMPHASPNAHLVEAASILIAMAAASLVAWSYVSWQRSIREGVLQSSHAKSEFLSGMSHELRTPLNAIMGFADVLSRGYAGELGEKQRQYVDNIAVSSRHMLALVNDLLDISRIEAGKAEFNPTAVNVPATIATCVRLFEEDCQKRSITLEYQSEIKRDTLAMLDEQKFRQILLNLLSNALKFSTDGGLIKVEATLYDGEMTLTVTDNGHGIPEEHEQRIFERFFQVNSATDNKSPGTGLGLPISRYFAELHGGSIQLDRSGLRTQTRFVVTLPFVTADAPAPRAD